MGKQQKMSHVMIAQQKQENRISFTLENHEPEVKKMASYPLVDLGVHGVLSRSRKLKMIIYLNDKLSCAPSSWN
jgi:hypothetical protein